jgi:hypothetical protein
MEDVVDNFVINVATLIAVVVTEGVETFMADFVALECR